MKLRNSTDFFFSSLCEIAQKVEGTSIRLNYLRLKGLLDKVTKEIVRDEKIVFSNLFSRLAFICSKYKVSTVIHEFRIVSNEIYRYDERDLESWFITYWKDVNLFLSQVSGVPVPYVNTCFFSEVDCRKASATKYFDSYLERVKVSLVNRDDNFIYCLRLDINEVIKVKVHDGEMSTPFTSLPHFPLQSLLYLVHIHIDSNDVYYPSVIVLEPDYLIDVSAIAECNQDFGLSPLLFLKSKMDAIPNTKHLLIGNFANLVMDEVVNNFYNQGVNFDSLFQKHFENYPFEHLFCRDIQSVEHFREYQEACQMHFRHISKVVQEDFTYYGLRDIDNIALEPSFLNNVFGLQGRLDLFYDNPNNDRSAVIIELKSGSTAYPDYGTNIKDNHNTQLFLYYLMISESLGISFKNIANQQYIKGYILYSKVSSNNLRSDHINLERVQEICELRNRIILNEKMIQSGDLNKVSAVFRGLNVESIVNKPTNDKFKNILEKQYKAFVEPIYGATILQQAYFYSFYSFVAREQNHSKLGDGRREGVYSLASLWNQTFHEKEDAYSIFYDLVISQNEVDTDQKKIVFKRPLIGDGFASFRVGDSCVLYPFESTEDTAVKHRIFKVVIKSITQESIEVALRYRQNNKAYFNRYQKWALEKDFMDSGFNSMYRSLYEFMKGSSHKKDLLLGVEKPKQKTPYAFHKDYLSVEQNRILTNILSCDDYFILNGPPGTGKTSHIIKELIKELYQNSRVNILVLSYTNRAVDELSSAVCEALSDYDVEYPFIRIGSEHSCEVDYHKYLLKNTIAMKKEALELQGKTFSRKSLMHLVQAQRVFLSTVATINNQSDLLAMKKFDMIIIDEASQILEPQIVGILANCKRFVMIGDHKQLPAIVLQNDELAKTNNTMLEGIGLYTHSNSLFERLYNYCVKERLDYACDTLTFQGRMHKSIAEFPNEVFYDGILKEAFELSNLSQEAKGYLARQVRMMDFKPCSANALDQLLASKRMLFLDVEDQAGQSFAKANELEADLVVEVIKRLISLYDVNQRPLDVIKQIGVIAPFKNQIALIRSKLESLNIANSNELIVDTVERFQGGQKDIIIYSLTVSDPYQLESLVNLNEEQSVDRKLNVALTRAKEQMIIVGNSKVVSEDPIYMQLIEYLISNSSYQQL
ncbi:AAA family ATPase [Myroides sp. BIT-d1]|uniref:AAA family ATPase n=2 Tax=Flavobacteriaceae TaxID=49546 RepID=A0A6I3LM86_9FLAO|nr:AAA family ATPase [Myroides albus]MVX34953.1 AAA family ATPase [Myroides sp. LoEW2-1]